jgi:MFS transporter, DHA1 family, multidrug resistance protein
MGRQRRALSAAAFAGGPGELLDFLLPLWAGTVLGASASQVGLLVAVELAVSVVARPLAGVLADRWERRFVAGAGAVLGGVSCVGYAVAGSVSFAFLAAAVGGLGGALLWVALRAMVAERHPVDSGVFARLMSWQETGSWVAFAVGLTMLPWWAYRGVFLGCAAAYLVAGAGLLTAPEPPGMDAARVIRQPLSRLGRRLGPILMAVALTMTIETAVQLLLLLHLQRGFDLDVGQIALVYLPGAIALSVLPGPLHRITERYGRRRVVIAAAVASALFAVGLSQAPTPVVLSAAWVLSAASWTAVTPIEQAAVTEASAPATGGGMGLYESAALTGAAVGATLAGILYQTGTWTSACLALALISLTGAVVQPWALTKTATITRKTQS